jgi:hypothetical protein
MSKMGLVVAWFGLLAVAGCGGSAYRVSTVEGTVVVDGVPIDAGMLSFSPLESNTGQAISAEIKAGKYRSDKVPRGKSLVIISAFKDIGEKHVEFGITYPKLKNMIPEKYAAGIELNVDAAKLTHDFELVSK